MTKKKFDSCIELYHSSIVISLLKNVFFYAPMVFLFTLGDAGEIDNGRETATNESQVLFYDWKEDAQYGYKINRIIRELDLSGFRCIISRCDSTEQADSNYIVTADSLELAGGKMYYSLKMQDGKMYGFPRGIPPPEAAREE